MEQNEPSVKDLLLKAEEAGKIRITISRSIISPGSENRFHENSYNCGSFVHSSF
jgi:hypothetical protein